MNHHPLHHTTRMRRSAKASPGLRHIFSEPAFGLLGSEKTSYTAKR